MAYDYRGARDWVYGIIREGERVTGYTNTGATITERAVLLALVEFAPNIEPSTAALATMLGTSERAIRRLLRACEDKGFLTVELRPGQRSRYHLTCNPGLKVPPDPREPRTQSPPTPDPESGPPRTQGPPKQTSKADKKADKISASADAATFALESPAPKPKSNKDPGAHQRVVAHYHAEFLAKHGRPPLIDGADGTAFKRLLQKLKGDPAECCRRITIAFASYRGHNITIREIASKPDSFASAEPPRKTNGHTGPSKQPNHGAFDAHAYEVSE